MKRVALVVQRCHESIVGGSEALAWQYATLLRAQFEVDILTTTAIDYITWANDLPSGCEQREGVQIHRFPVTITRTNPYWHRLHERLLHEFHSVRANWTEDQPRIPWTTALQEEFVLHQGPYCEDLVRFLRDRANEYQAIIFLTYLYPTTYFGVFEVPRSKILIAPTLHDEPPAYLSIYRNMIDQARSLIWLTNAERKFGHELWGDHPGEVVSMAIDTDPFPPDQADYPYILYSGRVDPSKGCSELIDFFLQFKQEYPSDLRLILTGKAHMPIPKHKDIDFRGFVTVEEKFQLMSGAAAFVMPSPYESFSIVTLEAMAQETPVLVNGVCQVLVEHVARSQGGKVYTDYASFAQGLQTLLSQSDGQMGHLARDYVVENYAFESVQKRLIAAVNQCA